MRKILKILLVLCLLIIPAFILHIGTEIESNPPAEIINNYTLLEKEYVNRQVFIVKPKEESKRTNLNILYIHGGAYTAEIYKEHWEFAKNLVDDLNCTIILPDYPLAPKYTYKDVFAMMEPLYYDLIKQTGKENLIVMGDSAGGGIALGLLEKMGQQGVDMPQKTILISPWLDVTMSNPKIDDIQKNDPKLNKYTLKIAGELYAGEDGMESYLVNPIKGPLSALENIIIFTGTYDILNPDVHILQEKAEEKGVKIEIRETPKAIHNWILYRNSKIYRAEEDYQELIYLIKY